MGRTSERGVSWLTYVDRALDDLRIFHDATLSDIQSELDRRLAAQQRESDQRFTESVDRVQTALASLDKRLDGMNEFREALRDQQARMATTAYVDAVSVRMSNLEAAIERQRGRTAAITAIAGGLAVFITVASFVLTHIHFQ